MVAAFSSLARISGECSIIHSPPALFFLSEVEISSRTVSPLFYARVSPQWHSELRQLWQNVPRQVACELVSGYVPTLYLDSGVVSPLRLRWVKGVSMFRCNLPPACLTEWPGSFTCHYGNTRVERTPNKSQHTKLTLGKKIFPPLQPGFELATFRSRVWYSTNKLFRRAHDN